MTNTDMLKDQTPLSRKTIFKFQAVRPRVEQNQSTGSTQDPTASATCNPTVSITCLD